LENKIEAGSFIAANSSILKITSSME
jgi:hypothetical protein